MEGGDLVSFWAYCRDLSQGEAARELAQRFNVAGNEDTPKWNGPKPAPTWLPMYEALASGLPPTSPAGQPSMLWTYLDELGRPLFQRPRYDFPDGSKKVTWWSAFRLPDGKLEWKPQGPPKPRPLYGLQNLKDPNKRVVLVAEGEKAADAAQALFPAFAVVTSGSSESAGGTDWTPLRGWKVVLWPDHDESGLKYAGAVAAALKTQGVSLRVVEVPARFPEKWDLADPAPAGVLPSDLQRMIDKAKPWAGEEGGTQDPPLLLLDPSAWGGEAPPPLRYLLDGLLPEGVPATLAGKSNSGKSLIAMMITFAVATGRDLFGRKGPSEPMFVFFVEFEDSPEEVHRRYLRCLDLFREDPSWNAEDEANLKKHWRALTPNWSSKAPRMLPDLVPYLWEQSRTLCANGGRMGIIVLDPLASFSSGEENKAETHQALWSACYAIAENTGATPLVIHHVRKLSNASGKGPYMAERLSFDSLRGSTAIVAGARAIIQVEPLTPEEAGRVGLDEERAGSGNYVVLALTKNASGPKGSWMALEQREAGDTGAGFFVSMSGGDRVCAALRSKAASAKLNLAEAVLLSIADGLQDRKELAKRHWPTENEEKSAASLKAMLAHLRNRHGWLQKGRGFDLTVPGFTRVQKIRSLQGSQAGSFDSQDDEEIQEWSGSHKEATGSFDGYLAPTGTETGSPARTQRVQAPPVPGMQGAKEPNPYRGNPGSLAPNQEDPS